MTFVMRGFLGVRVWAVTVTLAMALGVLGATASAATAASPPIGFLASAITTQGGFGTMKGRLVWGGAEAPRPRNKFEKGKADKNSEVCEGRGHPRRVIGRRPQDQGHPQRP